MGRGNEATEVLFFLYAKKLFVTVHAGFHYFLVCFFVYNSRVFALLIARVARDGFLQIRHLQTPANLG